MQLSIVIFSSMFILCCAGFGQRVCNALQIQRGSVAAMGLLCAVLAPVEIFLQPWLCINPAYVVLLIGGMVLAGFRGDTVLSIAAGFVSGIIAWLAHWVFPDFAYTGLIVGSIGACMGRLLHDRRTGLMCPLAAPLFFGFLTMLEDWYLFDISLIYLGSPAQLDGQALGLFLYGITAWLPNIFRKVEKIQKINA